MDITKNIGKALIVRVGEDLHAIPIAWVEEVLPALPVASLPQCPGFVRGVVFVRGQLILVLNSAERLGLKNHQRPDEPNIVCVRHGERIVGIEFDEALDLMEIGNVESLDAKTIGATEGFFAGVIDHEGQVIRLLDPSKLVGEGEAAELVQVRGTG